MPVLKVRLTDEDMNEFVRLIAASGLSKADFIRKLLKEALCKV